MEGMGALVVEAGVIGGINREKFHAAGFDQAAEGSDQAHVFEFVLVAGAGGEAEDRLAPVAVDDYAEFETHSLGIPAGIFLAHFVRISVGAWAASAFAWRAVGIIRARAELQ